MGIAFDFFAGLTMSMLCRSKLMLPKIELGGSAALSLPDIGGLVTDPERDWSGVKAGASGRNLGPAVEKLKSLWPGEKDGAFALILDDRELDRLNRPESAEGAAWKTAGWLVFPKLNCPGWKLLVGLNLNSGACTFSFDSDGLLPWLDRRPFPDIDPLSDQGLLAVDRDRWCSILPKSMAWMGVSKLLGFVSMSKDSSALWKSEPEAWEALFGITPSLFCLASSSSVKYF